MTTPSTRIVTADPTVDIDKRTIRSTVATRALARDGGILRTENTILDYFRANPVVQAIHGMSKYDSPQLPVIGRALEIIRTPTGLDAVTQFADNELGRDYAYLYGVNPSKEVYARAWSFGWTTLRVEFWTLAQARAYVPKELWDERLVNRNREVWVASESEMTEYSAVPVGADRFGLSRAYDSGLRLAGDLLHTINMSEIAEGLRSLRDDIASPLRKDFQTLQRDGTSAALLGDSDGLLTELRQLLGLFTKTTGVQS